MSSGKEMINESWLENSTCFLVDESNVGTLTYTAIEIIIITVLMPIVWVFGILGNLCVIYTISRSKVLKSVTNIYLVNLAIVDTMFLCVVIPLTLAFYISNPVIPNAFPPDGSAYCKATYYVLEVSVHISILTLVLVSIERYLVICCPNKFTMMHKRKYAQIACVACWAVSCLYFIPVPYFAAVSQHCLDWSSLDEQYSRSYPDTFGICQYCLESNSQSTCHDYYLIYVEINQIIPLLAIPIFLILYFLIALRMFKSNSANVKSSNKRRKQVITTLLVIVVVYVVCITPFRLLNILYFHSYLEESQIKVFIVIGRLMSYCNAAINPIIFHVTSTIYRQEFMNIFCCYKHQLNTNPNVKVSSREMIKASIGTNETTMKD